MNEITPSPNLVEPLVDIFPLSPAISEENGLILDGEIVPVRGEQILHFRELQKRLGRKQVSQELLAAVPVALIEKSLKLN